MAIEVNVLTIKLRRDTPQMPNSTDASTESELE
jgi:hypothetical protein